MELLKSQEIVIIRIIRCLSLRDTESFLQAYPEMKVNGVERLQKERHERITKRLFKFFNKIKKRQKKRLESRKITRVIS